MNNGMRWRARWREKGLINDRCLLRYPSHIPLILGFLGDQVADVWRDYYCGFQSWSCNACMWRKAVIAWRKPCMYYVLYLAFLLLLLAQDVSAANVGSIATLSHTRELTTAQESAFFTFRANWLLPSPAFPVIRYVERYVHCYYTSCFLSYS